MPWLEQAPKKECQSHEAIRARLETSRPGGPGPLGVGRPVAGGGRPPQSPPGTVEPLPPAARPEPGRLVSLGRAGPPEGRERGQADLPLDRLLRLPLVSRHGAGGLLRRGGGALPERALRVDQGGPRGETGPRRPLHERRAGDDLPGRLADDRLPDAGPEAILRRDVLPDRELP